MNFKDFWYTVQHILRDKNIELSLEQFNRYCQLSNNILKKTVYGKVGEEDGYETEAQISDDLQPFKTVSTISLTSGIGDLPADYWRKVNLRHATSNLDIPIVENREFFRRLNNVISVPTATDPLATIPEADKIQVSPTSITSVKLIYLKTDTPAIVLELENGIEVYDEDNSTEFLWPEDKYIDLIRIFVGLLSVPMTDNEILAYTEAKIKEDN